MKIKKQTLQPVKSLFTSYNIHISLVESIMIKIVNVVNFFQNVQTSKFFFACGLIFQKKLHLDYNISSLLSNFYYTIVLPHIHSLIYTIAIILLHLDYFHLFFFFVFFYSIQNTLYINSILYLHSIHFLSISHIFS